MEIKYGVESGDTQIDRSDIFGYCGAYGEVTVLKVCMRTEDMW